MEMAKTIYLLALVCVCFLSSVLSEDDSASESDYAVELDTSNFDDAIKKNNHFIMFYAPWCGHCKRLHPLWEQLAKEMNGKAQPNVIIAKVDCTQHQTVCVEHEVLGYPTLRFFKLGESDSVKFKGIRAMAAITEFIDDQLNAQEKEKEAEEEAEAADDIDTPEVQPPIIKPSVYDLTEDNFARHVSSGTHFVKFFAPWCSHCQRLAPTWEKLGESLKSDDTISISKIDCTVYRPICQDFDVKGYPTLLWIENGKKIEKYSGSRDFDDLSSYVKKLLNKQSESLEAEPEETKKTEEVDKLQPLQLTLTNFAEQIEKGLVFIKFYAPWCGHCQQLSPTWDQLAAKLHAGDSGIKVAKVDCTDPENKAICVEQQVEGYPTLFAYKNGIKQSEYNGARSLADLQNYIINMLGHTEL